MTDQIPTLFAPAARAPQEVLERQARLFGDPAFLKDLTDAVPNILLILNQQRQIVHANRMFHYSVEMPPTGSVIGARPGEVMRCAHAFETEGGCGTTEYCQTCGGTRAILASQSGKLSIQECRITQEEHLGALDLRVACTPISVGGERFTVYAATDIADEKRREALERIFFHDVLNTAGGLQMYLEMLAAEAPNGDGEMTSTAYQLARTLVEEIRTQQVLLAAERGEVTLTLTNIDGNLFLRKIHDVYQRSAEVRGCPLRLESGAENVRFRSDEILLHRVVGNMTKNAVEASRSGSTITLGCRGDGAAVELWVHNEGVMPRDVQLQMFQRSFSTKGKGRGIGTYSIKLLGEKYLGGTVAFTSTESEGTTFTIRLPLQVE